MRVIFMLDDKQEEHYLQLIIKYRKEINMDIKFRKLIYKIGIIHRLCIKFVQMQNDVFFGKIQNRSFSIRKLPLNIRENKRRCFIVGNGPSLRISDLELIKFEDCFAANLIFKVFPKTKWRPKYYCIADRYARTGDFIETADLPFLFIGDYFWRTRGCNNKNAYCFHSERINMGEEVKFSLDIKNKLYDCCTITYIMLQIAMYLEYKEIYLLGIEVVLLGGRQELTKMEEFKIDLDPRIHNLVGNTDIMESLSIIRKSFFTLGCDTGLMHCASALDVRTMILLGATSEKQAKCYGEKSYSISKHLCCSPCFGTGRDVLCNNKKCMKDISVNEVFLKLCEVIKENKEQI